MGYGLGGAWVKVWRRVWVRVWFRTGSGLGFVVTHKLEYGVWFGIRHRLGFAVSHGLWFAEGMCYGLGYIHSQLSVAIFTAPRSFEKPSGGSERF